MTAPVNLGNRVIGMGIGMSLDELAGFVDVKLQLAQTYAKTADTEIKLTQLQETTTQSIAGVSQQASELGESVNKRIDNFVSDHGVVTNNELASALENEGKAKLVEIIGAQMLEKQVLTRPELGQGVEALIEAQLQTVGTPLANAIAALNSRIDALEFDDESSDWQVSGHPAYCLRKGYRLVLQRCRIKDIETFRNMKTAEVKNRVSRIRKSLPGVLKVAADEFQNEEWIRELQSRIPAAPPPAPEATTAPASKDKQ